LFKRAHSQLLGVGNIFALREAGVCDGAYSEIVMKKGSVAGWPAGNNVMKWRYPVA